MWTVRKCEDPAPPLTRVPQDQALDTLAHVVRVLGEHPVNVATADPTDFSTQCKQWVSHLLHLSAAPNGTAVSSSRRDWEGLRRFISQRRAQEHQTVGKAMTDLRQVVSTFVGTLNRTFTQEEDADQQVLTQMQDLAAMVEHRSPQDIKECALHLAQNFATLMERRKTRHHQQVTDLGHQVHSLSHKLTEAERQSAEDPLTRLYNRRVLDEALRESLALQQSFGFVSTLLMVDVDHFKAVNDEHGHAAGDEVLKALANTLVRCFPRRSDVVTRFGGEEFAVLLTDTTVVDAPVAVNRMMHAVHALGVDHQGHTLKITVSVGAAQQLPVDTVAQWLDRADACLYEAKHAGRDQAVYAGTPEAARV